MAGKYLHSRTIHEASHAVIARKLGITVNYVDVRPVGGTAISSSASYAARGIDDVAVQIGECEKDAIVALAGRAANRRELPHLLPFDLFEDENDDTWNVRNSILNIVFLKAGKPLPDARVQIQLDETMRSEVLETWHRLLSKTDAIVAQHWAAIKRVGTHLERHRRIVDQAELDDLIARAERLVIS